MNSQNDTHVLSTEQIDLISHKLENISFETQLNGEFLPSSCPIQINIQNSNVDNQSQQKNIAKATQNKSIINQQQNISTNASSKVSSSQKMAKNTNPKSVSQNSVSGMSPKTQDSKPHQEASSTKKTNDSQDPSKGLNDWLDSLLS